MVFSRKTLLLLVPCALLMFSSSGAMADDSSSFLGTLLWPLGKPFYKFAAWWRDGVADAVGIVAPQAGQRLYERSEDKLWKAYQTHGATPPYSYGGYGYGAAQVAPTGYGYGAAQVAPTGYGYGAMPANAGYGYGAAQVAPTGYGYGAAQVAPTGYGYSAAIPVAPGYAAAPCGYWRH